MRLIIKITLTGFILIMFTVFTGCGEDEGSHSSYNCSYTEIPAGNTSYYSIESNGVCNVTMKTGDGTRSFYILPLFNDNPGLAPDERYKFILREGDPNKIIINFMGGGACWSGTNCIESRTNYTYSDISVALAAPQFLTSQMTGVIDDNWEDNPFKDWTMVFLPYTTADLHWGSNNKEYIGNDPDTGEETTVTVYHRGFDNFLFVLNYLKENYPTTDVTDVFVTGQSAGAYGATINFPWIKEAYPDSSVNALADAGFGVLPEGTLATLIDAWGFMDNIPDWIPGLDTDTVITKTMGEITNHIADYYLDSGSRIAAYTSMYDTNQRFFYKVMLDIDDVSEWEDLQSKGYGMTDEENCNWVSGMIDEREKMSDGATNFVSYIGTGEIHTITTNTTNIEDMSVDGVSFLSWLNSILAGGTGFVDIDCNDETGGCGIVTTEFSTDGLDCSSYLE